MDVNLYGTIYTNQAAYAVFKKNGVEGSIINYASDVALSGMPNGAMYAASKAAVVGWTRSIAMEWVSRATFAPTALTPQSEQKCTISGLQQLILQLRKCTSQVLRDVIPSMV